jgi:hypothetical protein
MRLRQDLFDHHSISFSLGRPDRLEHGLARRLKTPACDEPAGDLIVEMRFCHLPAFFGYSSKKWKKLVDKLARKREKFVKPTRMSRHKRPDRSNKELGEMQLSFRLNQLPADLADANRTLSAPVPPDENALR